MMQFIIGVVVGIVVATVGLTGIAEMADKGVSKMQETVKEVAR
jgi:hypothetical protein